jgi:DNA-binding MarR family transcriptional regulator
MNLHDFLPYRLAVAAETVSRALAAVYNARFDLTRDEWRVLAWLAEGREVTATELGARSTLDKMQVSRALARMERDGLVERTPDPEDRRNLLVRLKAPGRALYKKVVPMAQAREAFLLDALDADERETFDRALAKLQARARQLLEQG